MTESERQLVYRAQQGDPAAFEALVQQHAPYVYNLALRMLNDPHEAEDMAQETFLRAWRSLPKFRRQAQFSTWLYRIVTNLCYNRLPRLKKEFDALDPDEEIELPTHHPSTLATLLSAELADHIHQAIDALPDSYRLLITLRHLQGLSYADIATTTRLPLGTVKTGIYRARQRLKEALDSYE